MVTMKGKGKRAEVKSEVVFLGRLLELVLDGRMLVPRFQRPYVWSNPDILSLLDSVFSGYPIGSILVWETDRILESLPKLGPVSVQRREQGNVSYILDGHQRIATLLGTLKLPEKEDRRQLGVDWRVFFDLKRLKFLHEPKTGAEAHHFPVSSLLTTTGFLSACRDIEEYIADKELVSDFLEKADQLANAMRNFQLPLISVSETTMENAVTVFARLNQRGRAISPDQMVSALTYKEGGFQLSEELDAIKEDLERRGFGNLDRVILLRVVLAAMNMDIYVKDFADLLVKSEVAGKLPVAIEEAQEGIERALTFLEGLGVVSDRLLPYGLQLVLLAEFFRLCPNPSQEQKELLERWFWVTSFTGWFGGVNSAQARAALSEIRDLAKGAKDTITVVNLEEPALPFPKRFDGRSARVRAYLNYLVSLEPCSCVGEKLEPGRLLSELGPSVLAYVVSRGISEEFTKSPANRMFVDRGHRGQAVSIFEGYELLYGMEELEALFASHGFGSNAQYYLSQSNLSQPSYRQMLIEERLETLIEGEREFLKNRNVTLPETRIEETVRDSDVSDE